jgi:hypothetical protein
VAAVAASAKSTVNIIDYTVQLYIMYMSAKGEFAITAALIVRLAKRCIRRGVPSLLQRVKSCG